MVSSSTTQERPTAGLVQEVGQDAPHDSLGKEIHVEDIFEAHIHTDKRTYVHMYTAATPTTPQVRMYVHMYVRMYVRMYIWSELPPAASYVMSHCPTAVYPTHLVTYHQDILLPLKLLQHRTDRQTDRQTDMTSYSIILVH